MNKLLLAFLIGLGSTLYGQTPAGSYFGDIEGTFWHTESEIDTSSVLSKIGFSLSLLEADLDSIKSNSIIVKFDKNVIVKRYYADGRKPETIFESEYKNNEEWHILSLIIDDHEVKYLYVPTSSGNYIKFFEMKK